MTTNIIRSSIERLEKHQTHIRYIPCVCGGCDNEAIHIVGRDNLGFCILHVPSEDLN